MKSLLESIFGGRENITHTVKEKVLWNGYDEAFDEIGECSDYSYDVYWLPENNDNILTRYYGPTARNMYINIRSGTIRISIFFNRSFEELFLELYYKTDVMTKRMVYNCFKDIKNIFKEHPDLLNEEGVYKTKSITWCALRWDDFKKKYKVKK